MKGVRDVGFVADQSVMTMGGVVEYSTMRVFVTEHGSVLLRRAGAFVFAMLMMVGLGVAAATPASAAKSNCPASYSCTWKNTNYNTGMTKFEFSIPDFGAWPGYDNSASSVYSHGLSGSCYAEYYPDAHFGHWGSGVNRLVLDPGEAFKDLSNKYYLDPPGIYATWGNLISSGRFVC